MRTTPAPRRRSGFTVIELLVVIGIIVLLLSILIPTVSHVRRAAQTAAVKQQISELQGAIERFYQDQHQYPGPLPDGDINTSAHGLPAPAIFDAGGTNPLPGRDKITQSENLVLGLVGGLRYAQNGNRCFDPAMVGRGMLTRTGNQVKKYEPYLTVDPKTLSSGSYSDGAGTADDSAIPEFLDRYPNPMPILYLRARTGAGGVVSFGGQDSGGAWVIAQNVPTQYDLYDMSGYTKGASGSIGEGKTISPNAYVSNNSPQPPMTGVLPHGLVTVMNNATLQKGAPGYDYPYDAFPYFRSPSVAPTDPNRPNATGTPRSKDQYILISAGPDRVYGTEDDVCSFGSVTE
jgi:prepilin-type N-terminal cleavage/methylation domain-containing protein